MQDGLLQQIYLGYPKRIQKNLGFQDFVQQKTSFNNAAGTDDIRQDSGMEMALAKPFLCP